MDKKQLQLIIKRFFDIFISGLLLLLLCPIFLVIAIAIKLDSSGPIFFNQSRLGLRGKTFRIYKFRTMIPNAEKIGDGLVVSQKDPRITRLGRFLRRYRLDEFPQLLNVLQGEMSLVGPRPLLTQFLEYYSETDRKRMLMRPGMTGWQQVQGGSHNTWEERVALDIWYVDHWHFWVDIKILFLTIKVVLKASTVYDSDGRQISGLPPTVRQEYMLGTLSDAEIHSDIDI